RPGDPQLGPARSVRQVSPGRMNWETGGQPGMAGRTQRERQLRRPEHHVIAPGCLAVEAEWKHCQQATLPVSSGQRVDGLGRAQAAPGIARVSQPEYAIAEREVRRETPGQVRADRRAWRSGAEHRRV